MKTILSLLFLTISFLSSSSASAQETVATDLVPRTKLEAFQAKTGTVIVRGFSRVGSATGVESGSILVETIELRDAGDNSKVYGITVEVRDSGSPERNHLSLVDYDEIDSLLKGLEYLGKVDNSVTQLRAFEADYRTRDDLVFSAQSGRNNTVRVAVSSGVVRPVTAQFRLEDLRSITGLIVDARKQLDAIQR
jgi:hypothetical protein